MWQFDEGGRSDDLRERLARLEEAVISLKSGPGIMQGAGGFALTVIAILAGSVLTRSFAVSDQITALAADTREASTKASALQEGIGDVKSELTAIRGELTAVRINAERIAARIGVIMEQPKRPSVPPPNN